MLRNHKRDDIVFKQQCLAEAAECDRKLFWSKYKQNKSATSPSHDAFNVEGTIISDPEDILSMWSSTLAIEVSTQLLLCIWVYCTATPIHDLKNFKQENKQKSLN